ncbi:leucyl aminopeptidase family protein [Ruania suaedae]|uniref:leucyl aminopeptidase family protein n=1 Tax=Ruania suaedae TaxID=2897774 RepID=UPI001E405AF4|nr:leucyl aminopeptidase family protein [Ruania suaedae]UFU03932.1 leucyl aminopeptidase family protein [Ruania suaedae]
MVSAPSVNSGPAALTRQHLIDWGDEATVALAVVPAAAGDSPAEVRLTGLPGYPFDLTAWAVEAGATGAAGEALALTLPPMPGWPGLPRRLVLVGLGDASPRAARRAGAALARRTRGREHVVLAAEDLLTAEALTALVEGLRLGAYVPPYAGSREQPQPLERATICAADETATEQAIDDGLLGSETTLVSRRLAATPASVKTPQWLAGQVVELGRARGLRVRVRDERWLAEHGLRGILAVGGGSVSPPRLVTIEHAGTDPAQAPVVLVGKGITFDSGGLSLKPREAMIPMKTDMAGAASVIGAVLGAAQAKVGARVIGVLPLAENAIGASSYRPGDVITMVEGTTVEIGNTDAEGRMVLADAMAWARSEYGPATLVDVATLTGAASLGLGRRHAALYATDDALRGALEVAAQRSGEQVWAMPLVPEYRYALESTVADLSHIATDAKVGGGSITAALFLQHFAGDQPWAHLDIAGPARSAADEHEVSQGATGFGARLLLRWLQGLE